MDCLGRKAVAGRLMRMPIVQVWRRQKSRKTGANELAGAGIGRSTVLVAVAGEFDVVGSVHHFAKMHRMIVNATRAHARRGRRRHHGDCKYGKHGDETCDHASKIGTAHENVHCRRWRALAYPRHSLKRIRVGREQRRNIEERPLTHCRRTLIGAVADCSQPITGFRNLARRLLYDRHSRRHDGHPIPSVPFCYTLANALA